MTYSVASGANNPNIAEITEWSGIVASSPLNVTGTSATGVSGISPATVTSGLATTTNANDLVVAAGLLYITVTGTVTDGSPSGGFTGLTGDNLGANGASLLGAYHIETSTGTYSTSWGESWTNGGNGNVVGCIAAFKLTVATVIPLPTYSLRSLMGVGI